MSVPAVSLPRLSILLTVLAIAALVALACGGGDDGPQPDSEAASPVTPSEEEQEEPAEQSQAQAEAPEQSAAPAQALPSDPDTVGLGPVDASEARFVPSTLGAADEFGWSGAVSGDWMVISAPFHDRNGPQSGTAFVYRREGEVWSEHQQLLAPDGVANDWFARWVQIDGDTLIATAPFADLSAELADAGAVYVFERGADDVWSMTEKLTGTPAQNGQLFGWNAALDGDTLIVGANGNTAERGGVSYIFRRGPGGWEQEALLQPATTQQDDDFGFYVALDGDTAVVGSPRTTAGDGDAPEGAAFVYVRRPAGWQPAARLSPSPRFEGAEFGSAITIQGDTIVVGAFHAAPRGTDSGAVYVFKRRGEDWAEGGFERLADELLLAEETVAGDWFGYSLALLDDTLVIGTPRRDHPSLPIFGMGVAYLFSRAEGPWREVGVLRPDDAQTAGDDAGYGWDVWLTAETIGVGAWLADNPAGVDAGSAFVYRRAGTLDDGQAIATPSRPDPDESIVAPVAVQLIPALGGVAFESPVELVWLPDGRALVAEQHGELLVVAPDGSRVSTALDLRDRAKTDGFEQGLLSVTLDPAFESNGYVWIFYTRAGDGATRLSRVQLAGAEVVPGSELVVLETAQPFENHNGGSVRFGPDGLLYLSLGDGGAGGDPQGNGQNLGTLLGSVLRIDVSQSSAATPYAIPADNPFVGTAGARPEIWAYGLRNPWRMSFDPATGLLWVGDVGQDAWEEVNVLFAGGNFGWARTEGVECFGAPACQVDGDELPISIYGHDSGCSITGGEVYRGGRIPGLAGAYVFGDFCSGQIWALDAAGSADVIVLLSTDLNLLSFATDNAGGLFVLAADVPIQQIVPVEKPASAAPPGYRNRFGDD